MEKKVEETRGEKSKRGEVGVMNRWLETNHIQSQQTVPLFTEGIERKGSPTLLDDKSNLTDSDY